MTSFSLRITALTTQGEGIGKRDGKVVFVPFTLPREEWDVTVVDEHKNFDRALPVSCVQCDEEQAIPRTEPPCPYFGACGGCQLQHIPYENQLQLKKEWLQETFQRLGHLDAQVNDVIAAEPWGYRNKVTIPVIQQDNRYALAYHRMYMPNEFETIQDCGIAHPHIRPFIQTVTKALNAVKPTLVEHGKRPGSRAQFRILGGDCVLSLLDMTISKKKVERLIDRLFEPGHPLDVLEMTEEETGALLTISRDKEEERTIESHSFLQVNDKVCELLYEYVLSRPYRGAGKLLDGYCGVGLLTERFLETFKTVIGIEADRSSATDAKNRIKERNLFPAMTVNNQTIEQFLRHTKEKFDTVILNPPRSGMSKEARQSILKTEPKDVVMISCHPAAMVRDLQEFLDQGFAINSIQPFDMFPQTHHLETVLHLQR